MRGAVRAALTVICLIGCDAAPPPHQQNEAMVQLGTLAADGGFAPYGDGQDVTLVAGAQGGFHVWMSYLMMPAPSGGASLTRTAHLASDGTLILRTMSDVTLEAAPSMPLPMFMCPAPVGISVLDVPIDYALDFSDGSGALAHGTVTLVPHCPTDVPGDQIDFCQRICNG
jgi:hypothetical protein